VSKRLPSQSMELVAVKAATMETLVELVEQQDL
jgi:hypothetical protein